MRQDELFTMGCETCIVQITGKRPFKDKKYDLTKHPRYKYHSNGQKYWFDIEKYFTALEQAKGKNDAATDTAIQEELKVAITTIDGSRKKIASL